MAKVNDRHFTNVCSIISWRIFRIRNAALRCSSMNDRQLQRPALDCLFWSVPVRRHFGDCASESSAALELRRRLALVGRLEKASFWLFLLLSRCKSEGIHSRRERRRWGTQASKGLTFRSPCCVRLSARKIKIVTIMDNVWHQAFNTTPFVALCLPSLHPQCVGPRRSNLRAVMRPSQPKFSFRHTRTPDRRTHRGNFNTARGPLDPLTSKQAS